jgi:hypothetical protein
MEKSCASCSRTGKLIPIGGSEKIYLCSECSKSLKDPQSDCNVSISETIDPDNDICSDCLIDTPSYLSITSEPFQKYCLECCRKVTRTGEKMFIQKKWHHLVRTLEDLPKRDLIKEKINSLKQGFSMLIRQLENAKDVILTRKNILLKQIDDHFKVKLNEITSYKQNLELLQKEMIKEAKDEIFKGKLQSSKTKSCQLLRSNYRRESFFERKVLQYSISDDSLKISLSQLISLSFVSLSSIRSALWLPLFHPKVDSIIDIYPDRAVYEETFLNSSKILWKPMAAWCSLEEDEILYSGGEENNVASSEVFLIQSDKQIKKLASCIPKKNHCLVYHQGVVFSFGGYNDFSERYIQFLDLWEKIPNSPESFGPCSAVSFEGNILIAGYKRKDLYVFDPDRSLYQKVPGYKQMNTNASKLLLVYQGIVYLLQREKVFLTKDLKTWEEKKITGLKDVEWHTMSTPLNSESIFYILLNDYRLISFNCQDFRAEQIIFKSA